MTEITPLASVPAIEVHALTKEYSGRVVVDHVDFTVPFGAITGFVGANGSGKTTTMRVLVGLVHPSSGTSMIAGRPLTDHARPQRVLGAAPSARSEHFAAHYLPGAPSAPTHVPRSPLAAAGDSGWFARFQ